MAGAGQSQFKIKEFTKCRINRLDIKIKTFISYKL